MEIFFEPSKFRSPKLNNFKKKNLEIIEFYTLV
nr:MAG TPA: hypothetical protein [Caudoviricetes sp.]